MSGSSSTIIIFAKGLPELTFQVNCLVIIHAARLTWESACYHLRSKLIGCPAQVKNALTLQLLLLLVLLTSLVALLLTFTQEISSSDALRDRMVIASLCFSVISCLCCLLSHLILTHYVEPITACRSTLLSGLPENADAQMPLPQLSELIVSELEASRQREKSIAEFSTDVLCCLNAERRFLSLNLQSELLWGYPIASLLASPVDSITLQEDLPILTGYLDSVKTGDQPGANTAAEFRVRHLSGKLVDVEWQCEWSNRLQCYYCLVRDISDRKNNERLRSEYSAMITHDLRSPVAGISYFLESLSKGLYGEFPASAHGDVDRALEGIDRVLALINRLMDADKLEDGKMEANIKVIPLSEVYDNVKALLSGLSSKKNISLKFPESDALAFGDYEQVNQILCNLVSNAIKFSPAGSVVVVSEKFTGTVLEITIRDSGRGISEELKPVIFERFKSLSSKAVSGIEGTGLGLYIAKKLVELQDGAIGVRSPVEGGSAFWFSLKRAKESDII